MFSYVDPALQWTDIKWIKKVTNGLPVVVKGIQCAEDAALASHYGASAIYLSNHGGKSFSLCRTPCASLPSIRIALSNLTNAVTSREQVDSLKEHLRAWRLCWRLENSNHGFSTRPRSGVMEEYEEVPISSNYWHWELERSV
jgi:hypothetical protein